MRNNKLIIPIAFCFFMVATVSAQVIDIKHKQRNPKYVKDFYKHHLILRAFECTKFNNFKLIDESDKLVYKPNRHNDLGLGFNYRALSLNLEFNIPVTEKSSKIYGVTHTFDLQTYIYIDKFLIDLYSQFYRGYYLSNTEEALTGNPTSRVLVRPDMKTVDLSLNVQYVLNDRHFSFNAPFFQNEIQKKSAGSPLIGAGVYYMHGKTDSSFIPTHINYINFFQDHLFNRFNYLSIGVNLGYAYTCVIKKQFFITGALSGGPGIGYSTINNTQSTYKNDRLGIAWNATAKFAAGWSNDKYFAGVTYIRLIVQSNSAVADTKQQTNAGNFMFTVADRFKLRRSLIPKSGIIRME